MTKFLSDAGWAALGSLSGLDHAFFNGTFAGNGANVGPAVTKAHGLGKVPSWVGITAQGGFFGWENAGADATNVYMTFESPLFVFTIGVNYGYRCIAIG